jgi:hypothetical protein
VPGWQHIPQVPRPQVTRGRWLARERADDAQGRFSERVFQFVFPPIPANTTATLVQPMTSMGGRFVRCLAIRGSTGSNRAPTPLDQAFLLLRLQLNGENDWIGGNGSNFASFASLFDNRVSPWFRFLSPPLLRTGDLLTATVKNTEPTGEVAPLLQPQVGLRIIDDDLWQELYTRDWQVERSCC